ncbi:MAG: beta-ketoacyl-[acyl-carrier-protein] synthase II [Chloroflexota bacterium]
MTQRVVVTGVGVVSPLGLDAESTWRAIVEGQSGVGPITLFDASNFLVQIAAEIKGYDPTRSMEPKEARRRDRYEQIATTAAQEAIAQSGLEITEEESDHIAVIVGSAIGGVTTFENQVRTLIHEGPRRISPFAIPMIMPNGASGLIAIDYGIRGPNYSPTSACASGADAIGQAFELIRRGQVVAAITGGAEATITPIGIGGFDRTGAMSRRNDPPYRTPAPFSGNRDGLVMGEGAAILVLESLEHAQARGAEILAEIVGYGATADATHVTAPAEGGIGQAKAMAKALEQARVCPDQVDYINAHGTATLLNDKFETMAIKHVFGEYAYKIPVSSTKSMTGHMMGATGALEAVFCVQAIRDGVIPPTINYEVPDPDCDLDYVPNEARQKRVDVALSNAFGFGGHNAVLVFRRFV